MPVDYQLAKIYKLESPKGLIYIGSTCQSLAMRKAEHKRKYKQYKNGKYHNITSFKLFDEDLDNIEIYLVESFPCNNNEELHAREGYWIKNTVCVNRCIAGQNRKEHYVRNVDKIKAYKCTNNICACGGRYNNGDKSKHFRTKKHIEYGKTKQ